MVIKKGDNDSDFDDDDDCDDYDVNGDLNRFIIGVPLNHTKISPGIVCVRLSHPDLQLKVNHHW